MARPIRDLTRRFWQHVARRKKHECWEWSGDKMQTGYGRIYERTEHGGYRQIGAHRLSFMIHHSVSLTSRDFICHKCDNPPCVNPHHLFLGTQKDNMQDAKEKKRTRNKPFPSGDAHPFRMDPSLVKHGSQHRNALMTEDIALEILRKKAAGAFISELVKEYGFSKSTIGHLCSGRSWKHLHATPGTPTRQEIIAGRAPHPRNKLTAHDVSAIRELLSAGTTGVELAARFNVSRGTISHINNGKR